MAIDESAPTTHDGEEAVEHDEGRRRFFRRGAAAVAATAAAGVVLSRPAGAANGDTMYVGTAHTGTSTTSLSGSQFRVTGGNNSVSINGRHFASNGTGVLGEAGTSAVAGTGVKGYAQLGQGVHGEGGTSTSKAIGLRGTSQLGPGLHLDDGPSMPPQSGSWLAGSFVVDGGALWYCYVGGTGTASRWARLSGVLTPLPTPVRAYDSRVGTLPATGPKTRLLTGVERDIDLTGAGLLPAGTRAAYINVTAVNTGPAGFLKVFPNGAPNPTASNVNWYGTNQIVANSTLVGLDANGLITVRCGGTGASTDFIIDLLALSA